jgi:hypothetical protein
MVAMPYLMLGGGLFAFTRSMKKAQRARDLAQAAQAAQSALDKTRTS